MFYLANKKTKQQYDMRCNNSKVSWQIGSQGVLLLIQDKQLMEQIIYKLCNC